MRQFVAEPALGEPQRCLNWAPAGVSAFKRPKKRLLKADEAKREAFVAEYTALKDEAQRLKPGADEAHFRAARTAGQVGDAGVSRR